MSLFYLINTAVHFPFMTQMATPATIAITHSVFNITATDCVNVLNMSETDRSRLIEAEWQPTENKSSEKYMADIQVFANNRTGLLVDLSKVFTERKIDMRTINSRTNKQEKATISISFEIGSKEELASLIEKLRQIESVLDVERGTPG